MTTYELWTLAVVGAGTGEQPWASLHKSHADALVSVVKTFEHRLADLTDAQLRDEEDVSNALDDVATFTIELAIIDTDALTTVPDYRPKIRELIAPHVNRWGFSDAGDLARAIRNTINGE